MEQDEFRLSFQELSPACEAILFASGSPVASERMAKILNIDRKAVDEVMDKLILEYESDPWGGLMVRRIENSYVMSTKPGMKKVLERMFSPKMHPPLSQASYETLAVIAYNQPVTRAQVEAVRGVSSDSIISRLLDRGWVEECGNLDAPGRPSLFRTTDQFLMEFGISSVDELPSMELMSYQTIRDLEESLQKAAGNDDRQITIEGYMRDNQESGKEEGEDGEHN